MGHYGDRIRLGLGLAHEGWAWWVGGSKVTETPVLTILTVNLQTEKEKEDVIEKRREPHLITRTCL